MPAAGGGNYTMIGHTNPTTAAGGYGVGTLNGASLIVSFGGAPTLDYSVSTTIGGYGFTASKSGLGITGNAFTDNAPNLSGTGCAPGCTGRVAFLFTGSAAERAGLSYLIDASTGPGFKVNGVVVFKAP